MLRKMYTYLTLLSVLSVFAISCSSDDETFSKETSEQAEMIQIQAAIPMPSNNKASSVAQNVPQTRLSFSGYDTGTVDLTWTTGDAFELYAQAIGGALQVSSTFTYQGGSGISLGRFNGSSLTNAINAFYPSKKVPSDTNFNDIDMVMTGQTQVGNDDTSSIQDFTYMTDDDMGLVTDLTNLQINFKHETSHLRFKILMPDDVISNVREIKFTAPSGQEVFVTSQHVDGTSQITSESIDLTVTGTSVPDNEHFFTGYMAILPTTLTVGTYTITVTTEDGETYEDQLAIASDLYLLQDRLHCTYLLL